MASSSTPPPPIEPMLAKFADELPDGDGFLFEPKWDGMRAIVFRTADGVHMQGRDRKPLNRYFPELERALVERLPKGCIVDGEIVVMGSKGLDFDTLQRRLQASPSLVSLLAKKAPASFVAFDLLAAGGTSTREVPQAERRVRLERLLGSVHPPLLLTPTTRDRAVALDWLQRFRGAGFDGVVARPEAATYQPAKRVLLKIKHSHSADCVVTGFRWWGDKKDSVGALRLGLFDDAGALQDVGVTSAFSVETGKQVLGELAALREAAPDQDPSWEPLRPERVCEVKYDHLQGRRFRDTATFLRWRLDKPAQDCRQDQLEVATPAELGRVFRLPG